jgi:hypothetical protein
MRTIFVKDPDYDGFVIWLMLHRDDPSGAKHRSKKMGIDEQTLKQIYGTKTYNEVKTLIKKLVQKRYVKESARINEAIRKYQTEWDKINDNFYQEVERVTNKDWQFPKYKVVVSPFHPGVSNRGNNVVIRSAFEDPSQQKRITAHEILMIHVWSILDTRYPEAKKDPLKHFWGLNEITTVAILGLEPKLNRLWTKKAQGYDQYLANYPQLKLPQMSLKKTYLAKKDFGSYLQEAISVINKKYPKTNFAFS